MSFPTWLNKLVIGFKPIRYTAFWCWYRLICHDDMRLDDRFLYQDFWNSINEGQAQMVDDHMWLTYFGAKPEKIILPREDYDALVEKLNQPPDPKVQESLKKLLQRKSPWD